MSHRLPFRLHAGRWAVAKLAAEAPVPEWALHGSLSSVTRTPAELSIVCPEERVPDGVVARRDWACLELLGPFPFELTGILLAFIAPLAEAGVPIFALSTYDTDWVLVPASTLETALAALKRAGHPRVPEVG